MPAKESLTSNVPDFIDFANENGLLVHFLPDKLIEALRTGESFQPQTLGLVNLQAHMFRVHDDPDHLPEINIGTGRRGTVSVPPQ